MNAHSRFTNLDETVLERILSRTCAALRKNDFKRLVCIANNNA